MRKLRITIGNKSYDVTVEDLSDDASLQPTAMSSQPAPAAGMQPVQSVAPVPSAAAAKPQLPIDAGTVTSPMAGAIKSLLVKQGEQVNKGQPLVILEAMKMENQITAPVAGQVKSIDVKEGDSVQEGQALLVLE